MKIGLLDVDGHNFPNVPLMKISAYHKRMGDDTEFFNPLFEYDKVYVAKVFDFTDGYIYPIRAGEVICGGTGYGLDSVLPGEIEHIYPDYSLYGINDTAYGFLTRGCPNSCPFCIVSQKEGRKSIKVADLQAFWNGQKHIKLLDPNLLACNERESLLTQLADSRAWVDFTQGLDIRLMTDDIARLIMGCKVKMIHFAWDNEADSDNVCRKLERFKKLTSIDMRKARVYVLTNYNTTHEFDLYRVDTLKALGFDPYIMIYNKQTAPQYTRYVQRWVNNKRIFRSGKAERFEDYRPGLG